MIAADSAESGPGRDVGGAAQCRDLALGDFRQQRRDQIGLAGEIAIDRAGRDAGALRHGAICTAAMPPSLAACRAAAMMAACRAASRRSTLAVRR